MFSCIFSSHNPPKLVIGDLHQNSEKRAKLSDKWSPGGGGGAPLPAPHWLCPYSVASSFIHSLPHYGILPSHESKENVEYNPGTLFPKLS